MQVPCLFLRANSMLASNNNTNCRHAFRVVHTTKHSNFDCFLNLLVQLPMCGPFFSRSLRNRSATRASRNFLTIFFPVFCKINFARIAHTPCRKAPLAKGFSDMNFSSAWVCSNGMASTTGLFRFFGSPPACSVSLNAHFFPSLQLSY